MRLWRALKGLGCVALRDGVYLIPESHNGEKALAALANDTIKADGSAHLVRLESRTAEQHNTFTALFDRTAEYGELKREIDALRSSLATLDAPSASRTLTRLQRDFESISDIDFFPGKAREQVSAALSETEAKLATLSSPDEPRFATGNIALRARSDFQNRSWATRKALWVDRMASAWLIRRFIDPGATFVWLAKPLDCPADSIGFDFAGAAFTHVGSLVTFEVLLKTFGLESDRALARLGALVHFLDVGGIPVAEAFGLEMILKGAKARCRNDDELLDEASTIFDDLHTAFLQTEASHG